MVEMSRRLACVNRVRFAHWGSRVLIELCCHAANILYLLSYLGRDMLWLRHSDLRGADAGRHLLYLPADAVLRSLGLARLFPGHQWVSDSAALAPTAPANAHRQARESRRLRFKTFHGMNFSPCCLTSCARTSKAGRTSRRFAINHSTKKNRSCANLAFSRLSRGELLNLLTRRMWNSIIRLKTAGWKRSIHQGAWHGRRRLAKLALANSAIGVLLIISLCGAYFAKYASRSATVDSPLADPAPLELGRPGGCRSQAAWPCLSMRESSLSF